MTQTSSITAPTTAEFTHMWLITLQRAVGGSVQTWTLSAVFTPVPGSTRQGVYREVLDIAASKDPRAAGANVLFFSVEPNRL